MRNLKIKRRWGVVAASLAAVALAVLVIAPALAASVMLANEVLPATPNAYHVGDVIHYQETVNNTNGTPAYTSVVFKFPDGSLTTLDASRTWAVDETKSYTVDYTIKGTEPVRAIDGRIVSVLYTDGYELIDGEPGDNLNGAAERSSAVLRPAISVTTTVDFDDNGTYGEDESYYPGTTKWRSVVRNDGNVALTVTMTDNLGSSFGAPFSLAPGASRTFDYTSVIGASPVTDVVTATGVDFLGGPKGTVSDTDDAVARPLLPSITIDKLVEFNPDGVFHDSEIYYAGQATWKMTVTNNGTTPLVNCVVTDPTGSYTSASFSLAVGESKVLTYQTAVNADTTSDATVVGTEPLFGKQVTAKDPATADVISPAISLTKLVDFTNDGVFNKLESNYAGPATWTVTAKNTGDTPLVNCVITDDSGWTSPAFDLAIGASKTFEFKTDITADITQDADVVGTEPMFLKQVTATDYAGVEILETNAAIAIKKYIDFDGDGTFSDDFETNYPMSTAKWKIVVTNTGGTLLKNVVVTDSNGHAFGAAFDLAAGASKPFEYSTTVVFDTVNLASASATDLNGKPVGPVNDPAEARTTPLEAAVAIEKTVDFNADGTFNDSETWYAGSPAAWKIVVRNAGQTELHDVVVTDTNGRSFGPIVELAVGASQTFDYTETSVAADTLNVATANAKDRLGVPVAPAQDDASVKVIKPEIDVQKVVDFNADGTFSDFESSYVGPATWKITVSNAGDVDLRNVTVTDSNGKSFGPVDLAVGGSKTWTYTSNVTAATRNVADAEGYDVVGGRKVTDTDDASVDITPTNASIAIKKYVDFNQDGAFSDDLEYNFEMSEAAWRIVVTNSGTTPLKDVTVTDSNGYSFGAPFDLAAGASKTFEYKTMVVFGLVNTATASAKDLNGAPVGPVSDPAEARTCALAPDVAIAKTVDFNGDGVFSESETWYAGSTAAWKIVVTNTGRTELFDVLVTDTNGKTFGPITYLPAGESRTYDYTQTAVAVDTTNTATVTARDRMHNPVGPQSDDASVKVINPAIAITKRVDFDGDGVFHQVESASAAVAAAPTGSAWAACITPPPPGPSSRTATWTILVSNTGDVPLTQVMVTDSNGKTFGPITLAVGGSQAFTYATAVSADTTNTASASGKDPLGGGVGPVSDWAAVKLIPCLKGDISITKRVDFDGDGVFHQTESRTISSASVGAACITPNPSSCPATWTILVSNTGPVALTDVIVTDSNGKSFGPFSLAPGASKSFTYTTNVTADLTNTATVRAKDPLGATVGPKSDWAAVKLIKTTIGGPTRTIGYWKNHWAQLQHIFTVHMGSSMDLGYKVLTTTRQVHDVLSANPTQDTSTMTVLKARALLARQLAAAMLNGRLDNGASAPIDTVTGKNLITAGQIAASGNDMWEMLRLANLLDRYNNSGDAKSIIDSHGLKF